MKPQEWYNNNLSDTKQSLNKVNKTILYISIIRILLFHRIMEPQHTDYHNRSLLYTCPFPYNDKGTQPFLHSQTMAGSKG